MGIVRGCLSALRSSKKGGDLSSLRSSKKGGDLSALRSSKKGRGIVRGASPPYPTLHFHDISKRGNISGYTDFRYNHITRFWKSFHKRSKYFLITNTIHISIKRI